MRTSAGFVPSYSSGTHKTRDRTNPPVTGRILAEIARRWGGEATGWAVALLFDDLFNWNSWLWANRREAPRGLLSWGSNPYPYAPDGTPTALHGCGGGCANLESGLDNGPVMDGIPFNASGLYLQDECATPLSRLSSSHRASSPRAVPRPVAFPPRLSPHPPPARTLPSAESAYPTHAGTLINTPFVR